MSGRRERAVASAETVSQRQAILETLADKRCHKPELIDELGRSRSTIDRAIDDLERYGYVTRHRDGYETTTIGRLALDRYRRFEREQRSIADASRLLATLPIEHELPSAAVTEGSIALVEDAHQLFERLVALLRSADRYRAVLPTVADSRQLRLWRERAIDGEFDLEVLVGAAGLQSLASEFPTLYSTLVDARALRLCADDPTFGIGLVEWIDDGTSPIRRADASGVGTTAVVIGYDGDEPIGLLTATDDATVQWAQARYRTVRSAADDPAVTSPATGPVLVAPSIEGDQLPMALRSMGFVRVDERIRDRQAPRPPAKAWRTGLGFPDVAAGYAVPRRTGDESADTLAAALLDRLHHGTSVVVLGPSGSGKSTVCKRAACAWDGVTLYRHSGRGESVDAGATLETALERTCEPTLVVVEDAIRQETNEIFRILDRFRGDDRIAFLLDACESEWTEPESFPIDARLEAIRREHVEPIHVPRLDPNACERIVEHVEEIADQELPVSSDELFAELREAVRDGDDEPARTGMVDLLFRRLARTLESPGEDDDDSTLRSSTGTSGGLTCPSAEP